MEDHEAYMQEMDEERLEFEKTLALSKEEIARLEAERDRERELMMEALVKDPEERGEITAQPTSQVCFYLLDNSFELFYSLLFAPQKLKFITAL